MHRSQQARRRLLNGRSMKGLSIVARTAAKACEIDVLEKRRLFSGETVTAISPVLANTADPSLNSIALDKNFSDSTIPGTLATFNTSLGTITVALTDEATPLTVANFLGYVNSGAYDNTIFHRSAVLAAGTGGSPTTPADIIQGGGYVIDNSTIKHIATSAPVDDEYTTELYNDSAGTLAMAKTSQANSATSEWYFNVHDNSSALDTPTTDSNGVTTSYTVFGKVITGMNFVDEIAALPTYNVSNTSTLSLTTVPVTGITENEATKGVPITANNFVYTDSISTQPGTTYTATSSNNALVTPKVTNGVLSFTYASGLYGTADITVVAKNLDGTSASTTFTVTVPNSATPSAGPTTVDSTAPNVITGTTSNFNVLAGDTDSVSALNQSSVAIVTQPAHGTATVDTTTGHINFTPTAGFTGSDSLTYTVADEAGTVSSPATVTLNVVAAPVAVTIGTATNKSLTFTQPNGVTGHLAITSGTAVVTFGGSAVTTTNSRGVVTATGADTTIASIVITDKGAAATLKLTSSGAVSLGSITDTGAVATIDAPNATIIGDSSFKSINVLIAAGVANSTLSLGSGTSTDLIIPTVTDTTVTDTGSIAKITSANWVNNDGGYYGLTALSIGKFVVTGAFENVLDLTSSGSSLATASIGGATQVWTIDGSIGSATFGTPSSTWSLAANGSIGKLTIIGNLTNTVTAASIGSMQVTGTTTGAAIDTNGRITSSTQIGKLKFAGAVTNSNVSSGGNITAISAPSLSTVDITDNTIGSLTVAGASTGLTLHTNASASNTDQIGKLKIGGAADTNTISTTGTIGSILFGSTDSTQIAAANIGSMTVAGTTASATITTSAGFSKSKLEIGKLKLVGAVTSSTVTSAGNIGAVTAGSLTGSHIYAGVSSSISQSLALPTATTDFAANASIGSVSLGKGASAFSNTVISADILAVLKLGSVNTSNSGLSEGVVAHKIQEITATLSTGGTIKAGPAQLKSAAILSKYETAKKLSLGDFVINLI